MRARRDASTHGGDITVYSMLAQDVILIAQANFTVGVRGSIPESRFDSSLTTLGVPRPKFSSIHARCSRAALDMHEFMLQCYYKNKGPNRREAPGGQSNADLHPTWWDCTPFPFPPAMSSPGDNRPVLPAHDDVLASACTATLRGLSGHTSTPHVAKGEGTTHT